MHRDRTGSALAGLTAAGGVLLLAQAVVAALTKQSDHYSATTGDVLSDSLLAAGLLVSLAGLEALRRTLATRAAALALAGQAALVLAIAATIAAGQERLDALYIVGTIAWIVGLVGVAIVAARSRDPRWRPALALPIAGLVALGLADAGGAAPLGLAWVALSVTVKRT